MTLALRKLGVTVGLAFVLLGAMSPWRGSDMEYLDCLHGLPIANDAVAHLFDRPARQAESAMPQREAVARPGR